MNKIEAKNGQGSFRKKNNKVKKEGQRMAHKPQAKSRNC